MSKPGLHSRNRHNRGYDMAALAVAEPALAPYLLTTPAGTTSIDFANPAAVKTLNRALLAADYAVLGWDIPPQYLCPPIPGRADALHYLADLLAEDNAGDVPRGSRVKALDIGVGANAVYPLIGHAEYGWQFVGVDIDPAALANVERILAANPALSAAITTRHQPRPEHIFSGVLRADERFALTLCNPPFHASAEEMQAAAERKWRGLGKSGKSMGKSADKKAKPAPRLNFGGQSNELWCPGGERAFLLRMVAQSVPIAKRCLWFTSLVSKADNLRPLEAALRQARVAESRVIAMSQGQKQSRLLAWTFHSKEERAAWWRAAH